MSRINSLFQSKKSPVFSIYTTAGFPHFDDTIDIMQSLESAGTDMIELGMPYSDPLADGPVIQQSSAVAIRNGMTISRLFSQLQDFRSRISIPVILMGYMNPVLQFGFEKFCSLAAEVGIDGLILPDLPEHEFESEYATVMRRYGLDSIFLVTPETSPQRVRRLDRLSTGFLYAVSSSSITGRSKNMDEVKNYLKNLKSMGLANPIVVGFGIRDRQTFRTACEVADGAIIGTAFVQAVQNAKNLKDVIVKFVHSILDDERPEYAEMRDHKV